MYLLYAPPSKFGNIPPGECLFSPEIRFWNNVGFCPKFYWKRIHVEHGCRDISPRFFRRMRDKRKLNTVTVFATGGLGDSMWAMPFIRAVKEKFPTCSICVVTERKNKAVWQGNPYIVGTIENLFWNVAGVVRKSDDVFTFGGIATILKKAMRYDPIEATFRLVGWPLPETKEQCRPKLIVTIDEGIAAENRLKELGIDIRKDKLITIGIEASTPNRSWPIEYARILTAKLTAEGKKVLWIGKNKDKSEAFLENLAKSCGAVNLNQKTDVRQAMALIAVSDLYIGPNSGLMVIATSLLIPTIGLFGAFKPSIRAKFYERFTGIWHKVACSPCNEHWTECQHGHPSPCMKVIIPEEVHREAVKLMAKYPRTIREKIPME